MANINDYLLWRGDLPINKKFNFNEIDSIILARFSYLIFDKIQMNPKETIYTISKKMKDLDNESFHYNGDKKLITTLGQSIRFKDMVVTDYVKINDKETAKQFSAITIHISNKEMYISFIGTDNTITGWKEDFNMAFMENVPCQIDGKEYLEKISKKYKTKKIRIGGHSKGGNVAMYAGLAAKEKIQNKIIKIYNYDGPGFNKNIINKYENNKIINKIETYIPQDSVIGRLLNHKEKITITLSKEKGLSQHDLYSWQVLKDNIITLSKNTDISEDIDKTLKEWLETTTKEKRKIFVDVIFDIFYSSEEPTFKEISQNLSITIPKMLKNYALISPEDKQVITEMIKKMIISYMNIIKQKQIIKLDNIKEEYITKSKNQIEKLDKKYNIFK